VWQFTSVSPTLEVEAGEFRIPGQLGLHSNIVANKNKKRQNNNKNTKLHTSDLSTSLILYFNKLGLLP
jgi:hypothetical protein